MPNSNSNKSDSIQVGADKVLIHADRVVILAAREMDWPLREFCRVPIFFQGCKFYLRAWSAAEKPFAARYELWVWPENLHDQSPRSLIYDEAYVQQRDAEFKTERFHERGRIVLLLLYPLLGFLWSGVKERSLAQFGINAISATRASVMLAFNFCILEGIFVGWLHSGIFALIFQNEDLIPFDWFVLFPVGLDCLVRAGQLLAGDANYPYGFFEWAAVWIKRLFGKM